jgi:hypothetical protein
MFANIFGIVGYIILLTVKQNGKHVLPSLSLSLKHLTPSKE